MKYMEQLAASLLEGREKKKSLEKEGLNEMAETIQ